MKDEKFLKIMKSLYKVKEWCRRQPTCHGCPFANPDNRNDYFDAECELRSIPWRWRLDQLKEVKNDCY
jgi:hypothetical protein